MLQHSLNFIGCRSSSDAALLEFSFGLYQYSTTPFGPSVKFAFALLPLRHRERRGLCALAPHFDLGIDLACSAAARVSSSQPISALPLRDHLAVCGPFTRRYFIPKFAASVPVHSWDRFPFFWSYLFFVVLPYSRLLLVPGQTDVFSRLRFSSPSVFFYCCSAFLAFSSAESQSSGAAGRVSRSRSCTSSASLLSRSACF